MKKPFTSEKYGITIKTVLFIANHRQVIGSFCMYILCDDDVGSDKVHKNIICMQLIFG